MNNFPSEETFPLQGRINRFLNELIIHRILREESGDFEKKQAIKKALREEDFPINP